MIYFFILLCSWMSESSEESGLLELASAKVRGWLCDILNPQSFKKLKKLSAIINGAWISCSQPFKIGSFRSTKKLLVVKSKAATLND